MENIRTFFSMGGYGDFVWPAFGLTAAVLVGLLVSSVRRLHAAQRALERLRANGAAPRPGAGS